MKKKKHEQLNSAEKKPTETKAFELHTEEIERLVAEDESLQSADFSKDEINDYKSDKLSKIPIWLKALFIKFWFNGAVCYFFLWGLGIFIPSVLDQLLVLGIAMGIVTDVLVNNILRFFDEEENYTKWAIFPRKKYWTFIANILYSFVILACVVISYYGINIFTNGVNGTVGLINLGVEPILFALLYLLFDVIFVGLKMFIQKIIKDANNKLSNGKK